MADDKRRERGMTDETRTAPPIASERPPAPEMTLTTVPRELYDVAGEHGRGGIGRVLRADDRRLGRPVAVKELLGSDPAAEQRFIREARLTARLQHPAIVPIYEAGRWPDGKPFYSMRFISGRSLRELIDEAPTLSARLALLPHVVTVAEAIAYAHQRRVIHRDLKPNNVIVGDFGETMVIDWGLAKALDGDDGPLVAGGSISGDSDATHEGALIGTPAYMAPEQARGEAADERSDIYALGAMLYAVVSGAAPYASAPLPQLLASVTAHEAPPIRRRVPEVMPELAAIIDKAMAADPKARYGDASALVSDLKRLLTGQLVAAHRYSWWALAGRWVARHRTVVMLSSVFAALLLVGAAVALRRIVHERDRTRAGYDQLILERARGAMSEEPAAALAWLKRYPLDAADWAEARRIALRALDAGPARHVFHQQGHAHLFNIGFSRDGKRMAGLAGADEVRVWDLDSGATQASVKLDGPAPFDVRFLDDDTLSLWSGSPRVAIWRIGSPRIRFLETGLPDGVCLVRGEGAKNVFVTGGQEVREVPLDGSPPRTIARFAEQTGMATSASTRRLLAVEHGKLATMLTFDGKRLFDYPFNTTSVYYFTPDERTVVNCEPDGIHLTDALHGTTRVISTGGAMPTAFSTSDDQRWAVGAAQDLRLIDLQKGTVMKLHDGGQSTAVAFIPGSTRFVSAGADQQVRIWNLDGTEERAFPIPDRVLAVGLQVSEDGRYATAVGARQTIRVWKLPPATLVSDMRDALWMRVSADGTTVVVGELRGAIDVLDVASRRVRIKLRPDQRAQLMGLSVAPDGRDVAWWEMAGAGAAVTLWHPEGNTQRSLRVPEAISQVLFTPDGGRILVLMRSGTLAIWSRDGAPLGTIAPVTPTHADQVTHRVTARLAFVPQTTDIALTTDGSSVELYDWMQARHLRTLPAAGAPVTALAAFADGKQLALAAGKALLVVPLADGAARTVPLPVAAGSALALSDDGRFAALSADTTAYVIDLSRGEVTARLPHEEQVTDATFSPDGKWLATGCGDSAARLWSSADWTLQRIYGRRQQGGVRSVRFLDGGKLVAWSGIDIGLHSAVVPDHPDVPSDAPGLLRWLSQVTTAIVAPGERLRSP